MPQGLPVKRGRATSLGLPEGQGCSPCPPFSRNLPLQRRACPGVVLSGARVGAWIWPDSGPPLQPLAAPPGRRSPGPARGRAPGQRAPASPARAPAPGSSPTRAAPAAPGGSTWQAITRPEAGHQASARRLRLPSPQRLDLARPGRLLRPRQAIARRRSGVLLAPPSCVRRGFMGSSKGIGFELG